MLYALEGSVASGVSPSEQLYCQLRFARELSSEMAKRNLKHGVRYKVMHVCGVLINCIIWDSYIRERESWVTSGKIK